MTPTNTDMGSTQQTSKVVWWPLYLLFLIVLVLWAASWFLLVRTPGLADWSDRGTFGDMFGAVNALFSGLAFAGVIYALFLQRRDFDLTLQEFMRMAETQERQEQALAEQLRVTHDWNRRIAAQQEVSKFSHLNPGFESLNAAFDFMNCTETIPVKLILDKIAENSNLQLCLHELLNLNERLARGVFQGIYDEEVIKVARLYTMCRTFNSFRSYILHRRKTINPTAYNQFEALVVKWTSEASLTQPRPPADELRVRQ